MKRLLPFVLCIVSLLSSWNTSDQIQATEISPAMQQTRAQLDLEVADGANHIFGFNYMPSWAYNGYTLWQNFDADTYASELARGKELFPAFNTVRIWLDWSYYKDHPTLAAERFDQAVDICASQDLLVMPVLFNRWTSDTVTWGTVSPTEFMTSDLSHFDPFLNDIVGTHQDDPRILAWDLCNEPSVTSTSQFSDPQYKAEYDWLSYVHDQVKQLDSSGLTCVGTHGPTNMGSITLFEPMSDIITTHPYFGYENGGAELAQDLRTLVSFAENVGKPVLATETCWGSVDDAQRTDIINTTLRLEQENGIGFMAWVLYTSHIADAHGPEVGAVGNAGDCAFIELDGSLRPGHDAFNNYTEALPRKGVTVKPVAVTLSSGSPYEQMADYAAEKAIDGDLTTFCVLWDDTLTGDDPASKPANGGAPTTGHMIFDMGEVVTLAGSRLVSRLVSDSLNPKNVDFFYYADDDPTNNAVPDDIEGDPDIIPILSSYEFLPLTNGLGESVQWDAVTARYIGMRINSSYEEGVEPVAGYGIHYNYQIGEIEFYLGETALIPGDANNDGKVDGSDVTILAGNWQVGVGGVGGATWAMGDFNGDGAVDGSDVTILAGNWQHGVSADAASVPEPSVMLSILFGLIGLFSVRRSKR